MTIDYYEILGVNHNASSAEIRTAYRVAAKRCHPDKGGSHEQMLEVIAAWKILSDPAKKGVYDAARVSEAAAQAQWYAVRDEASRAASAAAREHGQSSEDFVAWVERVANEVEQNTLGRKASGAVIGSILAGMLGAVIAPQIGVDAVSGFVIGTAAGAVGGFFAAKSKLAKPKPL